LDAAPDLTLLQKKQKILKLSKVVDAITTFGSIPYGYDLIVENVKCESDKVTAPA
jgi:hypothetical protein